MRMKSSVDNSPLIVQVHENKPRGFNAKVQVATCSVEVKDKLLLLQLPKGKKEEGFWGIPGGKIEINETPEHAALRELFEETGIRVHSDLDLQSLGALYICTPEADCIDHLFRIQLPSVPDIQLSKEHQSYKWVSKAEIKEVPLMLGGEKFIEFYYKRSLATDQLSIAC